MSNAELIAEAREYINRIASVDAKMSVLSILRRLADALEAQEWQPIKTAPRDGRKFLAWREDEEVEILTITPMNVWRDCCLSVLDHEERPTHWLPLPAPPRGA